MTAERWETKDRGWPRSCLSQSAFRLDAGEQFGTFPYDFTMAASLPILYTKKNCPWCEEVITFMNDHGVGYRQVEVSGDSAAFAEMQKKSGQTKAPTLDWNGKILADFGVDELVPFLRDRNVKLEDS